ncbi:lipase 1-like, partial [Sitodiplosis mosellana]|uniref:lipase 1-like n=1 Tax=Sitodiplosis mosellana TaxID=263140 RepID=UPI0024448011
MTNLTEVKMIKFTLTIFIVAAFLIADCYSDPVIKMLRQENYQAEKHAVKTKDGYILTMHRIPNPNRPPILLMHGLADSTKGYLRYSSKSSTALELFELGYDIWMVNARANIYSRQHIHLNASDPQFWDFTWHEIGVYDIPATIDYILEHTNHTKLAFIGTSQGTTAILVTLSELPEYNEKLSVANLMAPAIIFKHMHAAFPKSIKLVNMLGEWLQLGGLNDLVPHSLASSIQVIAPFCMMPIGSELCKNVVFTYCGPSIQYYDGMILSMSHYPAGSSYKQFVHFGQLMATGKFHKFDYEDEAKNMEMYGSQLPPEYDLSKITTKIHMLYGSNDFLAPLENIPLIVEKLTSSIVTLSKFPGYNHMDFTYGRNLKQVNKKL